MPGYGGRDCITVDAVASSLVPSSAQYWSLRTWVRASFTSSAVSVVMDEPSRPRRQPVDAREKTTASPMAMGEPDSGHAMDGPVANRVGAKAFVLPLKVEIPAPRFSDAAGAESSPPARAREGGAGAGRLCWRLSVSNASLPTAQAPPGRMYWKRMRPLLFLLQPILAAVFPLTSQTPATKIVRRALLFALAISEVFPATCKPYLVNPDWSVQPCTNHLAHVSKKLFESGWIEQPSFEASPRSSRANCHPPCRFLIF